MKRAWRAGLAALLCAVFVTGMAAAARAGEAPAGEAPAAEAQEQEQPESLEKTVEETFAAYTQAGMSSEEAFERIRKRLLEYALMPWRIGSMLREDLRAWQQERKEAGQEKTPAELVSEAFNLLVEQGLDADSALKEVQDHLQEITGGEVNLRELAADILRRRGKLKRSASEVVEEAFARYIEGGMTSEEAFRYVQENLETILAEALQ